MIQVAARGTLWYTWYKMWKLPKGDGIMNEKETISLLNQVYQRLEFKGISLANGLRHQIFDPRINYYSGHYRRQEDGSFAMDYFPIPVVEVKGYCDVEINLDCVTVTGKLRREDALSQSYEKLSKYEFEAYGVEDYTGDLYVPGMTIQQLKENIRKHPEKEIGFSFRFDFDVDGDAMYDFVKLLRREGFYY